MHAIFYCILVWHPADATSTCRSGAQETSNGLTVYNKAADGVRLFAMQSSESSSDYESRWLGIFSLPREPSRGYEPGWSNGFMQILTANGCAAQKDTRVKTR